VTSATKPAESAQADGDEEGDGDGDAGRTGDAVVAGTDGVLVETTTVGGSSVGCEMAAGVQAERISTARTMPNNIFAFITASFAKKSKVIMTYCSLHKYLN
jgi:hypothetical protein